MPDQPHELDQGVAFGPGHSGSAPSPVPGLGHPASVPNAALLALAERVERTRRPDRELDLAIAVAVNLKGMFCDPTVLYQWGPGGDEIVCHYPPENGRARQGYLDPVQFCPRVTASIDAAMTLVPEGWQGERMNWWADCGTLCVLVETHLVNGEWVREAGWLGRVEGDGASPALALCAAALRARAASGIEARRAETGTGSVHESPVAESETPNSSRSSR